MEAIECIMTRRSAARLVEPAPAAEDLEILLRAAMAAPDHGRLRPWRFVVIRGSGLERLGDVFAKAHAAREPEADGDALERTRGKPLRAPLIVAVVSSPKPSPKIPGWEQVASAAAAAENLSLAAHALGYGCMWRTGWYAEAPEVREHLGLHGGESVMAWVYLGTTPDGTRPPPRPDDDPSALTVLIDD
jgi:nitroreductase